jgi:MinD superfamily P-loop ATPase
VAVNRCDLDEGNTRAIEKTCAREGREVAAKIPYDPEVTRAMVSGRPVVEHSDNEVSRRIRELWERLARPGTGGD